MGNLFNNEPKILKLIVRVRCYKVRLTSINVQMFFKKIQFSNQQFFPLDVC
jgi:hypothetical protein